MKDSIMMAILFLNVMVNIMAIESFISLQDELDEYRESNMICGDMQ